MAISREEVLYIARFARLEFDEEKVEEFAHQLGRVLDYINKLSELDVSDVEPAYHVLDMVSVMREDEVKEGLSQQEALSNAPDPKDGFFRVPRIIETS